MSNNHAMPADIHTVETIRLQLEKINCAGRLLDIGGGGEGIIGKLNGSAVVSIDLSAEELQETDNATLKIVMDATDLKFLNDAFDAATAFFSLMYVHREQRPQVFSEIYRVLKPGGIFYFWDLAIPDCTETGREIIAVPLEIFLPGATIQTGYGCRWNEHTQDTTSSISLAVKTGFKLKQNNSHGNLIELQFMK